MRRSTRELQKLADAGDYNLFRYCYTDPIDNVDPMGTEDQNYTGLAPKEVSRRLADGNPGNAQWAMAKWADSSNNSQGTFSRFAAGQGLTTGQLTQTATVPGMTRAEGIQKYGAYVNGRWKNEDKYITGLPSPKEHYPRP